MPDRLLPTPTPWSQPARSGRSSNPLLAQAPGTYYSYPHLSRAPDLKSPLHTPSASNANNAAAGAIDLARAYTPLGGALPKYPRHGLSAGSGPEQSSLGALFLNKSSSNVQVNLPGESSTSTIDGMPHGAVQFQDSSAAQMMQKLASKPAPRHQPTPLTDRIRVSCLNVGGELFVGDAGLFGVLCSCHQLRMSVAKFCEHAGGPAEKAGEIVLMENGMSIAHWFKYCVGVGSYVTDSNCDRPEWACIDPSPEGYRLKSLLVRNTSMEKVGLFNGYGKVHLNQISRPSGSPYITASTSAHH
uniref:Tify domain-containing protein n=1 Tax=Triticum urartu TaxID=4572 RepID=A0A8R7QIA7_TRIUA